MSQYISLLYNNIEHISTLIDETNNKSFYDDCIKDFIDYKKTENFDILQNYTLTFIIRHELCKYFKIISEIGPAPKFYCTYKLILLTSPQYNEIINYEKIYKSIHENKLKHENIYRNRDEYCYLIDFLIQNKNIDILNIIQYFKVFSKYLHNKKIVNLFDNLIDCNGNIYLSKILFKNDINVKKIILNFNNVNIKFNVKINNIYDIYKYGFLIYFYIISMTIRLIKRFNIYAKIELVLNDEILNYYIIKNYESFFQNKLDLNDEILNNYIIKHYNNFIIDKPEILTEYSNDMDEFLSSRNNLIEQYILYLKTYKFDYILNHCDLFNEPSIMYTPVSFYKETSPYFDRIKHINDEIIFYYKCISN